jgi:hypothetical protein
MVELKAIGNPKSHPPPFHDGMVEPRIPDLFEAIRHDLFIIPVHGPN